jgi:site-specific DNA recombinase
MDFAKLAELLDRRLASFASVTQQFNTNTSMGGSHLACFSSSLSSNARSSASASGTRSRPHAGKAFEWAAGRHSSIWCRDRKLVIDDAEAETVRWTFRRFVRLGSATLLARELVAKKSMNRYGHELDKGAVYKLLKNRVYVGDAVHKGAAYPGEHQTIINRKLGTKAHTRLGESPRKRGEIDRVVVDQVRQLSATPEVIVATWKEARETLTHLRESDVRDITEGRICLCFCGRRRHRHPSVGMKQARVIRPTQERKDG